MHFIRLDSLAFITMVDVCASVDEMRSRLEMFDVNQGVFDPLANQLV